MSLEINTDEITTERLQYWAERKISPRSVMKVGIIATQLAYEKAHEYITSGRAVEAAENDQERIDTGGRIDIRTSEDL